MKQVAKKSGSLRLKDDPETIAADAAAAVRADIDIIGPECAIPLTTPLVNLKAIAGIGRNVKVQT